LKPFSLNLHYTNDAEIESFEVVYSLLYITIVLQPAALQFPELNVIRFFTKDKKYVDIRSVDVKNDNVIRKWSEQCDLFWKMAYMKNELQQKQHLCDKYRDNIKFLREICLDRYYRTAKFYWRMKLGGSKIRGGRMIWVKPQQDQNEPIFFILFQHYISLQDDQKRKQVGFIILKFAYLTEEDDKTFTITTPRDRFTLQVTHETAKEEWISTLKNRMMSEDKRISQEDDKIESPVSSTSFKFKRLTNKMFLTGVTQGKENSKPIKLKSDGPWRIGRSRDNEIQIHEEECHVSRTHCEIEVIDNTPWIKDLGSAAGTYLNGKMITKAPLQQGDVIKIGNLSLKFEVKNAKLVSQVKDKKKKNQ